MIGQWFREEGVNAITVSSLSMATYFASAGWRDITVAFPVNLNEAGLIRELASTIRLGLLVEDPLVLRKLIDILRDQVDIYIKIDSGYRRTGLQMEDLEQVAEIVRICTSNPLVRFRGLLTHAGNTYAASGPEEIKKIGRDSIDYLRQVRSMLGGIGECMISVGDTPSCSLLESFEGADEIRPGNFVFYDLMQMKLGSCSFGQIGGVVACPVVALHHPRKQAVLYGGAVHLSKDRIMVGDKQVFGQMVTWTGNSWGEPVEGAYLFSLSQEHGILEAETHVLSGLHPGQIIGIIPVHSCLTANLMRGYFLKDGVAVDHMQGI
jgi:D-serine deaminase-like pyridoxal phosphate-dependent protein